MYRDPSGSVVLERPRDYLDCTIEGVHLVRRTGIMEPGIYDATAPSGRRYVITGGNSKRLPWRVTFNGSRVADFNSLPAAAKGITADDAARGRL